MHLGTNRECLKIYFLLIDPIHLRRVCSTVRCHDQKSNDPIFPDSSIAHEADNVVQMFLMSMNNRQHLSPPTSDDADGAQANNKTVLAQMRKEFFTKVQEQQATTQVQPKVTNKYLKPENRYVAPPVPVVEPVDAQVVQGFVAPQMHHAEVVHVR